MRRSRAATPAAKRRTTARGASGSGSRSTSRPAAQTRRPSGRRSASRSGRRARAGARSPRRRGPRSWRARLAIGATIALALGAGYLFWLRDSSLVAVDDVEVVGVTAGDREQIVGDLTRVAEQMTTLHVDGDRIEAAAAAFPTIESVDIDANFPHGMRIEVAERPPALLVRAGDREVPVADDGTVLPGVSVPDDADLPVVEADDPPAGTRLEGEALQQALVAGATPEPLRPLVEKLELSKDYGVEVILRGEIPVRFGTGARAAQKWAAAAAVLADPKLDYLTYLDVRVPDRPAAGGAA